MLRSLPVARTTAMRARTQAVNALRSLVVTAPAELREQLRGLSTVRLVRVAATLDPGSLTSPTAAAMLALGTLARRYQALDAEITALDSELDRLTATAAPRLLALFGVGPEVAGALLVAAGDNPQRLRSEAGFSMLCGSSPIQASSGKTTRHRLNRGGDRQANAALYRIVLVRLRWHQPTKHYVVRRAAEGKSKKEIIRCLIGGLSRSRLVGRAVASRQVSGDGLVAEPPDGQFAFCHPGRPETRRPASGTCPQPGPNNETPAARASTPTSTSRRGAADVGGMGLGQHYTRRDRRRRCRRDRGPVGGRAH